MISVICACNNRQLFNQMLLPSLKKQSLQDWELILIDAQAENLDSAASALNLGAKRAKGDILMFVHQDVELKRQDFLERLNSICASMSFGVGGVAGVIRKRKPGDSDSGIYSAVVQDVTQTQAGKKCVAPIEADSLDECLFFMKKKDFMGFDNYGKTWHFYAVEYSIRCQLIGLPVMIFPLEIWHLSPGWSMDQSYWKTLKKVANRYKGKCQFIPTTMGIYRNNALLPLKIFYKRIKLMGKKIIFRR